MSDEQAIVTSPLSEEEMNKRTEIAEDFYTVYCNRLRIVASPIEFRLFVGEHYPTASRELKIVENLSITMSPEQAKASFELLGKVIASYEAKFGPIRDLSKIPQEKPSPEQPQN